MSYRDKVWGMNDNVGWSSALPPTGLDGLKKQGNWTRSFDSIEVEVGYDQSAWIELGGADWKSYELSVGVTIISGANAQIPFRISPDGKQSYIVDFLVGWQALGISKIDRSPGGRGLVKMSVVNMEMQRGREYQFELCVRDASFTTYIEGKLINQTTDFDFTQGPLALAAWAAKVKFSNPKIRRLG